MKKFKLIAKIEKKYDNRLIVEKNLLLELKSHDLYKMRIHFI